MGTTKMRALAIAAATAFIGQMAGAEAATAKVNGLIAFGCFTDACVMNPDGTNKRVLVSQRGYATDLVFSPDGTEAAYAFSPFKGNDQIRVASVDGSADRLVTGAGGPTDLAWSADGQNLLYFDYAPVETSENELYSVPASGGSPVVVAAAEHGAELSSLSTGGPNVVFTASEIVGTEAVHTVYAIGAGAPPRELARGQRSQLSPDGSRVSFNQDGAKLINFDGTGLTALPTEGFVTRFSPDGTMFGLEFANGDTGVIGVDGSGQRVFPDGPVTDYFSSFSPDGKRAVIESTIIQGGEDVVTVIEVIGIDGSGGKTLTDNPEANGNGIFLDWQAIDQPLRDPEMALEVDAEKRQKAKRLSATYTCTNECEIELQVSGKVGEETIDSVRRASPYGNAPTKLKLLRRKDQDLKGSGRIVIVAEAGDQSGETVTEKTTIRIP